MFALHNSYEILVDGVIDFYRTRTSSRWAAAAAWYLARQNALYAKPFWNDTAAMMTNGLDAATKADFMTELTPAEQTMLSTVTDWPAMSDDVSSVLARWSPTQAIDLDALMSDALARIDRAAEAFRGNFITSGSGQAMAYQQKLAEARAFLADPQITEDQIPHVVLEAAAEGVTKEAKAEEIVQMFLEWQHVSALIEAKRAAAKTAVLTATSEDEIRQAELIDWGSVLNASIPPS